MEVHNFRTRYVLLMRLGTLMDCSSSISIGGTLCTRGERRAQVDAMLVALNLSVRPHRQKALLPVYPGLPAVVFELLL